MTRLRTTRKSILLGTLIVAFSSDAGALAGKCESEWTVNAVEENDSFIPPTDEHYTQGLLLSGTSGHLNNGCVAYSVTKGLADFIFPDSGKSNPIRHGIFFGHSIFTPMDLGRPLPDRNDRPYAGWLYGGINVYRESDTLLDKVQVSIGFVGPGAQGGKIQNWWHNATFDTLGGSQAKGWDSQLRNEPGIVLARERIWRIREEIGDFEIEFLPQLGATLGNIFTYGSVGALARFGQGLHVDWGPPRIEPALSGSDFINRRNIGGQEFAWYAFAGPEVRLVGRNIFLDGNTFEDSASVDKRFLVADLNAGLAVVFPLFGLGARVSGSYTQRTKEFSRQEEYDEFVSVAFSLRF